MAKRKYSYSDRNIFEQCPHKYFRLKVVRDVKDEFRGPAATYGNDCHKDLEIALLRGRDLPARSRDATWCLEHVRKQTGLKIPEAFLTVDRDIKPCGGRDPNAFNTAKIDVTVLRAGDASVFDHKTGKHSSDTTQLRDSAVMVMAHHPTVVRVDAHLLFTQHEGLIESATFVREEIMDYVAPWFDADDDVEQCLKTGSWPKQRSGLCGWCPVRDCENHPGGVR